MIVSNNNKITNGQRTIDLKNNEGYEDDSYIGGDGVWEEEEEEEEEGDKRAEENSNLPFQKESNAVNGRITWP